ncbi:FtsB family cell division protein [Edaphobacter sp. HDX4]|uniref:FtsB family cell division protein n=1 Tax=Edaphobacter sp. HDX4 TaxID=2794064 RepID=UPI002FE672CB
MSGKGKSGAGQASHGMVMRLVLGVVGGWRRWVTVAAAIIAIGMAYHVVFGQNGLTAYQRKTHDAHTLDGQLKSLQHENDLLKAHIDRLKDDPNAIEHQAREELHYTRPGEVIYTLPAAPAGSVQVTTSDAKQ